MPHQCTACGYTFADGSKDMLGGCPDCGGNKFQFYPEGTEVPDEPPGDESPPDPDEPSGAASTVGRAATKVRDFVSNDSGAAGSTEVSPTGTDSTGTDSTGTDSTAPDPDSPGADAGDTDSSSSRAADADATDRGDSTNVADRGDSTNVADRGDSTPTDSDVDASILNDSTDDDAEPDPNAPWPDSSDAADPIRKGGFRDDATDDADGEQNLPTNDDGIIDADAHAAADAVDDAEDGAQSQARSDTASDSEVAAAGTEGEPASDDVAEPAPDDVDAANSTADDESLADDEHSADDDVPADTDELPADEGRVVSEPSDDDADLTELREQLNDQFESIKILEPGQYELNLMELYDREEYIIALQENGRYVIQMPEQWMSDRETER